MATSTLYATAAELKGRLSISDATDDTIVTAVLNGASRAIDQWTNRRFYTTADDETRFYTYEPEHARQSLSGYTELPNRHNRVDVVDRGDFLLLPDDVTEVTTLATDDNGDRTYGTTWATTDYDLEPYNAATDGKPYTRINVTPNGTKGFPSHRRGVKIVGRFGYTTTAGAIPDDVHEAALILAARLFKRKDAAFGVAGGDGALSPIVLPKLDPDVKSILFPYRRMTIGAV